MKINRFNATAIFLTILFIAPLFVLAEGISLKIASEGVVIYSDTIVLSDEGIADIEDSDGGVHPVDRRSVLYAVTEADKDSSEFRISSLIFYSSFDAFYLKCLTISGQGEFCDQWLYKVNGDEPGGGMDKETLSEGDEVVLYFGTEPAEGEEEDQEENENKEEEEEESNAGSEPEERASSSGGSSSRKKKNRRVETEPVAPAAPMIEEVVIQPEVSVPEVQKAPAPKPKIEPKKVEIESSANTASVILAVPEEIVEPEEEKPNWFVRILMKIFGF